jgi:hypothetical protein
MVQLAEIASRNTLAGGEVPAPVALPRSRGGSVRVMLLRMPTMKRTAESPAAEAPKSVKGSAAPKLKGSAGASILTDLGLTDAELFAFLPPDAPKWIRGVFWCQFECDRSLDELMRHFAERYDVTLGTWPKFPEGAPADGIPVRQLTLRRKGRYAAYTFYGMRGDRYIEDGSLQLETSFGASGTAWGSNRAVYERFKQVELPAIGARNIVERTE